MAIEEEVQKLLKARFIREERYPTWLANIVLVKKSNRNWQMYINFIDLNKAYLKDCFLILGIDQLVESTSNHALLSFMNAFLGYNQIRMEPKDKVHTSFDTVFST